MENYTILTSKIEHENKFANFVIIFGSFFSSFALWMFISIFLDFISHNGFSTLGFVISLFFFLIGLVLVFSGLVDKVGKTTLILNDNLPVMKHLSLGKYTYGQKIYDFEDSIQLHKEFPDTDYPVSVLMAQKSGKVLNLNTLTDIKKTINSIENSSKYNNYEDIILASIFSLISIKAINLVKFKATETKLGVSIKNNNLKERYYILQGESYLEYKDMPDLGDIENKILDAIDLKNSDLEYQDDDFYQITKKLISKSTMTPEGVIPDLARKNGLSLGLFEATEERRFQPKEEFKDLLENTSNQIREFISEFENQNKSLVQQFRKDISLAIRVMDNSN